MTKNNNEILSNQYITFDLGEERYGIELNEGREILIPPEITRVPNTPKYIEGVINLRGRVIPRLDFKDILGIEKNKDNEYRKEEERVIITTIENITSCFMVDQMQGILTFASDDIETENQNEMNSEFIKGIYTEGNNIIPIIDLKRIISAIKGVN